MCELLFESDRSHRAGFSVPGDSILAPKARVTVQVSEATWPSGRRLSCREGLKTHAASAFVVAQCSRFHRAPTGLVFVELDEASNEELKEQVAAMAAENAELGAALARRDSRIAELEARLSDLEERLGRNPRNSSMPPSAEGLGKPPAGNRQQRRAQARRQAEQPGAEDKHLAKMADADEVLVHAPSACPDCGAELSDAEVVDDEVRQVFDLPKIGPYVREHHLLRLRCRCGCEVKARRCSASPFTTAGSPTAPRTSPTSCATPTTCASSKEWVPCGTRAGRTR